ncbi:transcription factor 7-like 2 isoform X2 [Brienomyrus brachyistius]|uniref:transcription factor 7-like 2 isoform X2 n=1 Tax=Brienomyrus brachyistius TaxID=42636 RepID=UPI0020B348B3|nr:transcription factor 7-like 2 isoform X2 [Brienomyrus brachyistius]
MPQLNSGGGDDFGANDEMISFKDEGEQEEKIQENALTESDLADLKSSLVNESEINVNPNSGADQGVVRRGQQGEHGVLTGKHADGSKHQDRDRYKASAFSGYQFMMLSDPYSGSLSPSSNSMPVVQQQHGTHPLSSLRPYSSEPFRPSSPQLPTDTSQKPGVHRPQCQDITAFYSLPPGSVGQIPHPMGWQSQPVCPLSSCGFGQSYPPNHPCSSSFARFPHSFMLGPSSMHATGIPHPAIVPPTGKQDDDEPCDRNTYSKLQSESRQEREPKKPVIKKPLNAFMLYMKEMRAKVIAECTLKESAAINQILGRRWHALSREEQAKYYELARKERQLHMQLYPSWSARDNYGKKKKRKREKQQDASSDASSPMKCRARFGLSQQTDWCGPCRRKKKCIRYLQGEGECGSPPSSNGSAVNLPCSPADTPAPCCPQSCRSVHALSALRNLHSLHTASESFSGAAPSGSASIALSLLSPCTATARTNLWERAQ